MSKFCGSCGAQIEDNAQFCGVCGAQQQVENQNAAIPESYAQPAYSQVAADGSIAAKNPLTPEQKKKYARIGLIALAAIVLIIVAVVVISSLTKYQVIDCKDLYYVDYTGINGQASANIVIATPNNLKYLDDDVLEAEFKESDYYEDYDLEGFYNSKASKWFSTEKVTKTWTKAESKKDAEKMQKKLEEYIEFKVDEEDLKDLSNGDTIKVKVKYKEEKLKKKNIKLENTEFTITVKGLPEAEKLDPASKIKVTFSGNDGSGTAEIDKSACEGVYEDCFYYSFSGYFYDDLSNGDKVTVEISPYYSLHGGYFTYDDKYYTYDEEALTKEYTVEGLTELEVIDPFEGVTIKYEGAIPFLSVDDINTDGCIDAVKNYISFDYDYSATSELKTGDTFVVTATTGWYDSEFADAGYRLASDSVTKTFTVGDEAPVYAQDISKVTKDNADEFFAASIAEIEENVGSASIGWSSVPGTIKSFSNWKKGEAYLVALADFTGASRYDSLNDWYQFYSVEITMDIDGKDTKKTYWFSFNAGNAYIVDGVLASNDSYLVVNFAEKKEDLINSVVKSTSNTATNKKTTTKAAS